MPRKSSQTETEITSDQQLPADIPDSEVKDDAILQTETESGDHAAAEAADTIEGASDTPLPQTETEMTGDKETIAEALPEESQNPLLPQTDADFARDEEEGAAQCAEEGRDSLVSQTDAEIEGISGPGSGNHEPELPDAQTETEKPKKPAPSGKTGRKRAGKTDSSPQSGSEPDPEESEPVPSQSDAEPAEPGASTTRQSRPARRQRRSEPIVSIDAERTVQTDADKLRGDILDLVESLKSRKILTGTIQGVERSAENADISFAVIYHGEFKVIIPAEETVKPPDDFRDRLPGDVMHYLVTKRLGAEVDYIVKGIDQKTGIAAASRLDAMAAKRREYYFGSDRDGNNLLYEGITAEARIVSVIRAGIFVDIFGLEVYIPLRELSYQRWIDAGSHFQSGQRALVKILSLDRRDRSDIRVTASVKQAGENPYEKALRRYSVGSRYVGTVSMVDVNGVFVSLDGGIDCLCSHPKRGRPPRGARVTVRILGLNHDTNRIWGAITHMTNR